MIDILPQIAHNYIAQAAFWGWFTAQAIKFVWQLVRHGKFRPERLVGSGGFPSSHTSFVIATTTAIYLKSGASDLLDYFTKKNIPVVITRKEALKELLGHTPIEVFGGLILGILVACIQFYYIYNGVI